MLQRTASLVNPILAETPEMSQCTTSVDSFRRSALLWLLWPLIFVLSSVAAGEDAEPRPLISAVELGERLHDPKLRLIDMGLERSTFDTGHLPHAQYVNWKSEITDPAKPERYNIINREGMQALLRKLGISRDSLIVVYDNVQNRLATRMYWSLRYYGHDNVRVLDGGILAWQKAGLAVTKTVDDFTKTDYRIEKNRKHWTVDMAVIAKHLEDSDVKLVDGRPDGQYSGKDRGRVFHTGKYHKQRGHIPGAMNIPWKANLNPDGTFKSRKELAEIYKDVLSSKRCITYCNEGLHAAMPWFVLSELLKSKDVAIYDDSMSEWANSDQKTTVTAEPKLKQSVPALIQ